MHIVEPIMLHTEKHVIIMIVVITIIIIKAARMPSVQQRIFK
jgi:hypothetical protein